VTFTTLFPGKKCLPLWWPGKFSTGSSKSTSQTQEQFPGCFQRPSCNLLAVSTAAQLFSLPGLSCSADFWISWENPLCFHELLGGIKILSKPQQWPWVWAVLRSWELSPFSPLGSSWCISGHFYAMNIHSPVVVLGTQTCGSLCCLHRWWKGNRRATKLSNWPTLHMFKVYPVRSWCSCVFCTHGCNQTHITFAISMLHVGTLNLFIWLVKLGFMIADGVCGSRIKTVRAEWLHLLTSTHVCTLTDTHRHQERTMSLLWDGNYQYPCPQERSYALLSQIKREQLILYEAILHINGCFSKMKELRKVKMFLLGVGTNGRAQD
jgi:hypothetical protein